MKKPRMIRRNITAYKCEFRRFVPQAQAMDAMTVYLPEKPLSMKQLIAELQFNFGDEQHIVVHASEPAIVNLDCKLSVLDLLNSGIADVVELDVAKEQSNDEQECYVDGGAY